MRRRYFLCSAVTFGLAIGALVSFSGCSTKSPEVWPNPSGLKVLTSFPPIYCFTVNVAGNDAYVISLLTNNGPHSDVEPTAHHLKLASKADVLFAIGLGIDDRITGKIKTSCGKPDFNLCVLGSKIDQKKLLEGECHHEDGHKHEDEHEHGFDPHVWLSAVHARTMVAAIRDELKRIDAAHAAGYDARAAEYIAKLETLEKDGIALLKNKKHKKIISFHDSLRYFADCYGLTIAGYIQVEPGVEPTADRMKEIIRLFKDDRDIRIIAVEPQFPRNTSAGTILAELKKEGINAEFVEIDPLETAEEAELTPDLYDRKMRQNLENLAKVLQ